MKRESSGPWLGWLIAAAVVLASMALACWCLMASPTEQSMGAVQRIMYIHISVAWLGLVGFIGMAVLGLLYLWRGNHMWDEWAQSIAEIGWLCATLTLVTGSLWARAAWGSWWTWDPRLITSFILWALYGGYHVLRNGMVDRQRSAKLASVLAILGAADVPLVVMATRWFRGVHPVAPSIEPFMRLTLYTTLLATASLVMLLAIVRRRQIRLAADIDQLEIQSQYP